MSDQNGSMVYEAIVTGVEEKKDHYGRGHEYTYYVGGILVRPPIEVGKGLNEVVLSGMARVVKGAELDLLVNTKNGTLFRAVSEGERGELVEMAARITDLANNPEMLYKEGSQ